MSSSRIVFFAILLLQFTACVSESDLDPVDPDSTSKDENQLLAGLNVPDGFSYETSKNITITLDAPNFLKGAVFSLYTKVAEEDSISIGKATFDTNAHFEKELTLSARTDSLLIFSDYAGLIDNVRLGIEDRSVTFDYRPFYERSGSGKSSVDKPKRISYSQAGKSSTYTFIDTFDSQGVPENMAFPDVIEQNFLDDVNASLPERIPGGIPASNPEYLAGAETNLIVTEEADIWVTFVSEGAGYRNVLGYYSYPVGEEPATVGDITEHKVIFPNVSMSGSGGGLIPGDRIYLGRFPANTVVSWFLVPNGWNGSGINSNTPYYSNPDFNPESTEATRTHMVLLYDQARELTLLGFEDLRRDESTDDDFNDAVFYAKANPVNAIQVGNMAEIQAANDSDGDGINDELDDFPFDVNKAFNNFLPSVNSTGKLAYEDLWPSQGDYDFNDLVLDYSFNLIANSSNLVTSIDASFTINNIGGALHNGFAMVLPIDPNLVDTIGGQVLNGNFESVAANGTELGTTTNETVIIVAGDCFDLEGQTIDLTIDFNTAIDISNLGEVPFNTFLIANQDRSKEIHLPDLPPTSKAGYLGTSDDYSDANSGRYYKTDKNLPWALNIYEGFEAPPENIPITLQYPKFKNWANSGGEEDQDWFVR